MQYIYSLVYPTFFVGKSFFVVSDKTLACWWCGGGGDDGDKEGGASSISDEVLGFDDGSAYNDVVIGC